MIFSSVKNIVASYIGKHNKNIYFDDFKKILENQHIHENLQYVLLKDFDNNFSSMFVESTTDDKDIAYGIMWFTLFNYCESIVSSSNMSYRRMLFFGPPGCGKTSYICSLIKQFIAKRVVFYSDNESSFSLLKSVITNVEISKYTEGRDYDDVEIYECNNIESFRDFISKYDRIRVFVCIPIHLDIFALNVFKLEIGKLVSNLSGIIITKLDCYSNISICLNSCYLLNSRILMFSKNEVKSPNRCINSSGVLSSHLLDLVFDKKMHDMETIKMLFGNNINAIDLQTYSVYLKFLMKFESINTDKIMDMIGSVAKKMNINDATIKTLQNVNMKSETFARLKKHAIILNSLRRCEKKYVWLIDNKRIKRIAIGAGASVNDVKEMLNSFDKYKQAMKYMNYYKFIDNIK